MYQENPVEQVAAVTLAMLAGAALLFAMQKFGEFKRNQALREIQKNEAAKEGAKS